MPAGEVAQLGDRGPGLVVRAAQEPGDLGLPDEQRLRHPELHAQRDESRLRAVVELALQALQLRRLRLERAAPRAGQRVDALRELVLAAAAAPQPDAAADGVGGEDGRGAEQRDRRPGAVARR